MTLIPQFMIEHQNKLVAELKKGDTRAFGTLIQMHQKTVFNTCLNIMSQTQDAEDLTQEVFAEVFRSISKFRGDSKLTTWIHRIAINKCMEEIKSRKRQKRAGFFSFKKSLDDPKVMNIGSSQFHPGVALENIEKAKVLYKKIEELSPNQRIAFTLSHMEGRSYKEIAEIMNLSLSAVESLVFRARTALKSKIVDFLKNNDF